MSVHVCSLVVCLFVLVLCFGVYCVCRCLVICLFVLVLCFYVYFVYAFGWWFAY